jgi:hypothetical protein
MRHFKVPWSYGKDGALILALQSASCAGDCEMHLLPHRHFFCSQRLYRRIIILSELGSQFMPPLFEGSALYTPTSLPGIAIEQAKLLLQKQDAILRTIPEVESVFGTVGRSDSATDNAPLDMYDTTLCVFAYVSLYRAE